MALRGELYIAGEFGANEVALLEAHFSRLLGQEVTFDVRRNENLIGGFLALVEGKAYDASVAAQLRGALDCLGAGAAKDAKERI